MAEFDDNIEVKQETQVEETQADMIEVTTEEARVCKPIAVTDDINQVEDAVTLAVEEPIIAEEPIFDEPNEQELYDQAVQQAGLALGNLDVDARVDLIGGMINSVALETLSNGQPAGDALIGIAIDIKTTKAIETSDKYRVLEIINQVVAGKKSTLDFNTDALTIDGKTYNLTTRKDIGIFMATHTDVPAEHQPQIIETLAVYYPADKMLHDRVEQMKQMQEAQKQQEQAPVQEAMQEAPVAEAMPTTEA